MSIAMNAETGKPLGRDLTELEEHYQAEWLASEQAKREGILNTARDRSRRRPVQHRPGTEERQERRAIYGAYSASPGTCPRCFMALALNGECTGCGD